MEIARPSVCEACLNVDSSSLGFSLSSSTTVTENEVHSSDHTDRTSMIFPFHLNPEQLDFLFDHLFSPKCQRISINLSDNRIFGVRMSRSRDVTKT